MWTMTFCWWIIRRNIHQKCRPQDTLSKQVHDVHFKSSSANFLKFFSTASHTFFIIQQAQICFSLFLTQCWMERADHLFSPQWSWSCSLMSVGVPLYSLPAESHLAGTFPNPCKGICFRMLTVQGFIASNLSCVNVWKASKEPQISQHSSGELKASCGQTHEPFTWARWSVPHYSCRSLLPLAC